MATHPSAEVKQSQHNALLNSRYHADREAFFDAWDRYITFGLLLTGGAAFLKIFGDAAQTTGAAVLTIFALARIVFEIGKKARLHSDLRRRYFEVSAQLEEGNTSPQEANAEMMRISGKEPPIYCAVHALAENWATTAIYSDEKKIPCRVGWFASVTRHWLRHESDGFSCD